ncbi:MAG: NAD(P)-binding domain-containing protein [Myxococcota bacterium]
MRIAVLGAGNVGSTIGRGLEAKHDVLYAVRDPAAPKYAALKDRARPVGEAIDAAEVVILSTPWAATENAIAGAGDFRGKPLLDATNPIGAGFALTHGHDDSGAEQVQRWAPSARVVKVFNTTGVENMANPAYPDGRAAMFLCGDDEGACAIAKTLCLDLGFEPFHVGGLSRARVLEPVAMLWIQLALVLGHGRGIALSIATRNS